MIQKDAYGNAARMLKSPACTDQDFHILMMPGKWPQLAHASFHEIDGIQFVPEIEV